MLLVSYLFQTAKVVKNVRISLVALRVRPRECVVWLRPVGRSRPAQGCIKGDAEGM